MLDEQRPPARQVEFAVAPAAFIRAFTIRSRAMPIAVSPRLKISIEITDAVRPIR